MSVRPSPGTLNAGSRSCLAAMRAAVICAVALGWLGLGAPSRAQPADPAQARVALVIGNARYDGVAVPRVAEQARSAAEALRQGGFDVVMAEDTSRTELALPIAEFSTRLRRGGLAVVFYAGQAVQSRGRNLLVPVDTPARPAQEVLDRAFDLDVLIDALIVSRPASALVLLDASRESPWQEGLGNGCNPQPRRQAVAVGQFPPNAFGLRDMAGNAAEWVADCWSENYRAKSRDGSAFSTPGCRERVLRGGSFNNDPRYLRSAARFKYESNVRFYTNGMRVLREP